ncbi:MAG: apolipoprotein N-acyltransferase [Candidatus Omnitrophica bacterium]|nr:apolipoprotein N-acyltransferase [Candidatus Omnitrophota bacterium]
MPRRLLILATSLLLVLAYPPFDLGWLAWIALVPWLFSLEKATARQAFRRSYLVGFLFFGGTIWWVGHVTIVGTVLLAAALALYFGLWGWLAQKFFLPLTAYRLPLFTLPASWALVEFLRSNLLTGFGWNLLAHTQWNWLPLIQMADLTGAYGVSFLVVLVNVAVWRLLRPPKAGGGLAMTIALPVFLLAGALSYGAVRLHQLDRAHSPSFRVAVLQGNIPQFEKWDEQFAESIWLRYETLTLEAALGRPDLIIWPETSVPGFLDEPAVRQRLTTLARLVETPLLVGVPAASADGSRFFNRALLVDSRGGLTEHYDKLHLVPFGEYLPLTPILGWLRQLVLMGDFSPGSRHTVFRPASAPVPDFSVLICFEDLFQSLPRRFVKEGARWLVVITNDAWFGRSAASLQHLQASVFRAVESRVWVVRAANTGWSGFVDPSGRRLPYPRQIPRFEAGFAEADLELSFRRESRYNR